MTPSGRRRCAATLGKHAVRMERRDRKPSIVATGPSEACAINAIVICFMFIFFCHSIIRDGLQLQRLLLAEAGESTRCEGTRCRVISAAAGEPERNPIAAAVGKRRYCERVRRTRHLQPVACQCEHACRSAATLLPYGFPRLAIGTTASRSARHGQLLGNRVQRLRHLTPPVVMSGDMALRWCEQAECSE